MHRYRDAIVYENKKTKANENCIFGAFVLFPYNNEEEFRNHDFYKSIEEVNIGAIPFLPSSTKLMEEFLDELINESPYLTFERALDQVGKEEYLKDEYFTNRNVLIGPVKDHNQLEVSLQQRFYHVPKSKVNLIKHNIEYVALAQSIKAFKDEAGITYYGKVESIKEVKRNEITEIPKNSDEPYYLINIVEWIKLPKKIEVMGYPVRRCLYTSDYLMRVSGAVAELFIKNKEEYRVWHELKRFAEEVKLRIEENDKDHETLHMECSNGMDIIAKGKVVKIYYNDVVKKMDIGEFEKVARGLLKGRNG